MSCALEVLLIQLFWLFVQVYLDRSTDDFTLSLM